MTPSRSKAPARPRGDKFLRLHDEFRPKILRYLARLVGEDEAEDLTQEVFLKVSRSLEEFEGRSSASTWIYRIATNAAIDRMRVVASGRDVRSEAFAEAEDAAGGCAAWADEEALSIEERVMLQEMFDCYREFVDRLPTAYRTVVVLSDLEDFAAADIAEILGLTLETVKMRLHRGRAMLYEELRAHCRPEDWPLALARRKG